MREAYFWVQFGIAVLCCALTTTSATAQNQDFGDNKWNTAMYLNTSCDGPAYCADPEGNWGETWNPNRIAVRWGSGTPCNRRGMRADLFSTNFCMARDFVGDAEGIYNIHYVADDGIRISSNGGATWDLLDRWEFSSHSGIIYNVPLSGEDVMLRVDHMDGAGDAFINVDFRCLTPEAGTASISDQGPVILSLSGYTGFIQWQVSTVGPAFGFRDAPGLSSDYHVVQPTQDTWYRASVKSCSRQVLSNWVFIARTDDCDDDDEPELNGVPDDIQVQCADEVPPPADVTASDDDDDDVTVTFSETSTLCTDDGFSTGVFPCGQGEEYELPGGYIVEFSGYEQDEENCRTTYYYCVRNNNTSPAISHFNFGAMLCAETCIDDLPSGYYGTWSMGPGGISLNPGGASPSLGTDPSSGVCGIKFDREITGNGSKMVYLTVDGLHTPGQVLFYIKAGQTNPTVMVPGPDDCSPLCECDDECSYTITRTWTATDDCGNSVSESQTILVEDNTPPTISCPADVTVAAGESTEPSNTGSASCSDNCDPNTETTFTDVTIPGSDGCSFTIERTWTCTDECGNSASCVQIISGSSDEADPPVIDCPADVTVSCDAATDPSNTGEASCNEVTGQPIGTTFNDVVIPGLGDNCYTIERTWTCEDECGNTVNCVQTISVVDDEAPVAPQPPADLTLDCDDQIPAAEDLTANDNCDGSIIVSPTENVDGGGCGAQQVITRTWTFVDGCGNSSSVSQVITVNDDLAPLAPTPPDDITVRCADEAPAPVELTATDNCDGAISASATETTQGNDCNGAIIRTWTFTDRCGNTASVSQTVTINNDVPPSITCPADITLEVGESTDPSNTGTASCSDPCDPATTTTFSDQFIPGDNGCSFTIIRTWTCTDACGNSASCTQMITGGEEDNDPPLLTCPPDVTIDCEGDTDPSNTGYAMCNEVTGAPLQATYNDVIISGEGNCKVIERTWTCVDDCGNVATCVQTIAVVDDEAPVFPGPEDTTLYFQCADEVPAPLPMTAIDNCDGEIVAEPDGEIILEGECGNRFEIKLRMWEFTDECGNTSIKTQTIIVRDTIAPVAPPAPGDITIECGDIPEPVELTAVDNCDGDITVGPTSQTTGNECDGVIIRTWTFTDDCGNSVSVSQTITIDDTTPPVPPAAPDNVTVQCLDDVPPAADLTATDECDGEIPGVLTTQTDPGNCINQAVITRTWTFTDECGNSSSVSQVITVNDNTPPAAPVLPTVIDEYDCAADVPQGEPLTAIDNCDGPIVAFPVDQITPGSCPNRYSIIRTWTFTDVCGNTSSSSKTIVVYDDEAPVPPTPPADVTVECEGDIPNGSSLVALDNCDGPISDSPKDVDNAGFGCPNDPLIITRSWTFEDACGNSSTIEQTITVVDETAPVPPTAPDDQEYSCLDDVVAPAPLTGQDNCDGPITANPVQTDNGGSGCAGDPLILVRTWTFTDDCDNSRSISQMVTVEADPIVFQDVVLTGGDPNDPCGTGCGQQMIGAIELSVRGGCPPFTYAWTGPNGFTSSDLNISGLDAGQYCLTVTDANNCTASDCWTLYQNPLNWDNVELEISKFACGYNISCNGADDGYFNLTFDGLCEPFTIAWTGPDGYTSNRPDPDNLAPGEYCVEITDNVGCSIDTCITLTEPDPLGLTGNISQYDCGVNVNCGQDDGWINIDVGGGCPPYSYEWSGPGGFTASTQNIAGLDAGTYCVVVTDANDCTTDRCWTLETENEPPIWNFTCQIDQEYTTNGGADCPEEASISLSEGDEITIFDSWTVGGITIPGLEGCVSDNCTDPEDLIIRVTDVTTEFDGCTRVITITFEAEDVCGNIAGGFSCTYTFTDDTPPVPPEAPDDVIVQCAVDVPAAPILTAIDNCDGAITVEHTAVIELGDCPNRFYIKLRTWTFTDRCGNSSSVSQTVIVDDTIPPVWNFGCELTEEFEGCYDDIQISLSEGDELTIFDTWTVGGFEAPGLAGCVTDNCTRPQDIIIRVTDITETSGDCEKIITVTFEAEDECGNIAGGFTCTYVFVDTTPPVAPAPPADLTVECAKDVPEGGPLTAIDDCEGPITVLPQDSDNGGSGCVNDPFVVTRTWTFDDGCGNVTSVSQTITAIDEQPPVWNFTCELSPTYGTEEGADCPDDAQISLNIGDEIDIFTGWTVGGIPVDGLAGCLNDNCTEPVDLIVRVTDKSKTGNSCAAVLTITFEAEDECGNIAGSFSCTYTIVDDTPPVSPDEPDQITVACIDEVPPIGAMTAEDNCQGIIPGVGQDSDNGGEGCPNDPLIITRTWSFDDGCGNVSHVSQTIRVIDDIAPTWNFDCQIVGTFTTSQGADCPGDAEISLDVGDVVTINDSWLAGGIEVPGIGDCVRDNCSDGKDLIIRVVDKGAQRSDCEATLTITFEAEDECGNVSLTFTCTYIFVDDTAPVAPPAPANTQYECLDDVPAPGPLTAIDACQGPITVLGTDSDNNGDGCPNDPLIITRTWTFDDGCGNVSSVSTTITVVDDVPPVAPEPPADLILQCAFDVPPPIPLTAIDNCDGAITVMPTGEIEPGDCPNRFYLKVRTWTFTDNCGNSTSISQTIIVDDTIAPEWDLGCQIEPVYTTEGGADCPADAQISLNVGDQIDVNTSWTVGGITIPSLNGCVTDNCTPDHLIVIRVVDKTKTGNSCEAELTITFEAEDECGNISDEFTCTYTFIDNTPPDAPDAPEDLTFDCIDDIPPIGVLTADDNCQGVIQGVGADTDNGGAGCPDDPLIITRSWTFDDGCGNISEIDQTIIIVDDLGPTWDYECQVVGTFYTMGGADCPDDAEITLNVGDEITIFDTWMVGGLTVPSLMGCVDDNCTDAMDIIIRVADKTKTGGGCTAELTITFVAEDQCGNVSDDFVCTYIFVDNTPPAAPAPPADVTVECVKDVPDEEGLTALDECQGPIYALPVQTDNGGRGCEDDPLVITRTWTFNDGCDNVSSVSQSITVIDDVAPVWNYSCELFPTYGTEEGADCPADAQISLNVGDEIDIFTGWTVGGIPVDGLAGCLGDNCTEPVDLIVRVTGKTKTGNSCEAVLTITFEAEDECGNIAGGFTCEYTIVDDTPPTPPNAPNDLTFNCVDDIPPIGAMTALDNCQGIVPGQGSDSDNGGAGCVNDPLIITRNWTFDDGCGNTSSVSQTIYVIDLMSPAWNYECELTPTYYNVCPDDAEISLEVGDEIDIFTSWTVGPNVIPGLEECVRDNCTEPEDLIIRVVDKTKTSDGCEAILTITFVADDLCGNTSATFTCIYTVVDNTPPVAPNPPPNVTVQCADDVPLPVQLTAEDECQGPITVGPTAQTDPGSCPNRFVMVRTWTFDDGCGNVSSVSQTITVNDDTDPIWNYACELTPTYDNVCPDDAEISLEVGDVIDIFTDWTVGPNEIAGLAGCITDNCTAPEDIIIRVVDKTRESDGCEATLTITFEAEDECGNIAGGFTCTYYIVDNTPPVAPNPPANVTVQCADDVPPPVQLTAEDECQGPITVGPTAQTDPGSCPNRFVMVRTWTFDDGCGNVSSVSQTITVYDNTAPVPPPAPADVTVQCAEDVPPMEELTAIDNCDGEVPGLPASSIQPGDCPNRFTIHRSWMFIDACGNWSTVSQNVTVNDDTDPIWNYACELSPTYDNVCPDDAEISLSVGDVIDIFTSWTVGPNEIAGLAGCITDNCTAPEDIIIRVVDKTKESDGCEATLTITFEAEDECGNIASGFTCTYYIEDNTPPVAPNPPPNVTVQCADEVPAPVPLTADDECQGPITVGPTAQTDPGSCPNRFVMVRTWIFDDGCGNVSSVSQTITVFDDTAPVPPPVPQNETVQCADDVPAPVDLTAIDNCDGPITVSPVIQRDPGSCPNRFTEIRTWTFTDVCGNTSSVSQTITVNDNTAPVPPQAPANETVQCATDVPAPVDLTAIDNCDGPITVSPTIQTDPGSCPNRFTEIRTWTFTDVCGNTSSVSQTITVNDNTAPVPPAPPANVNVQCADDVPAPVDLTANDNCDGNITVSPVDNVDPGTCPNDFVVTRTWTFTDICGNSSNVSQTITVHDDMAPVFPGPEDTTIYVQCAQDVPPPLPMTAIDNCDGEITVEPSGEILVEGDCGNRFAVKLRTWTFTDECGNTSIKTVTVIVNDTIAPVPPAPPANETVQCADDVPPPVDLTAIDNCDGPITVGPVDQVDPGSCANRFVIIRTWTFTDDCGNMSSVSQTITVYDDIAPVPPAPPANANYQCADDVPAPVDLTAIDNCDGPITVSPTIQTDPGSCPNRFVEIRTWTFTDVCGNSSSVSQTITVFDNTAPDAPAPPANANYQCADDVPAPVSLTAFDNCDGPITVSPTIGYDPGSCPNRFVEIRTWTFTDVCGNTSSVSQTITVFDDTAPAPPMPPSNANYQCADDVPAPGNLTAIDNCDGPITVSPTIQTDPGSCPNRFVEIRTWTFTDLCGNTSSVSQTITVFDNIAPVPPAPPANETVQCADDVPAPVDLTANDNCDGPITVSPTIQTDPGSCPNRFTEVRTWTFTDACGNTSSVTQTITVYDDTAPVPPPAPADVTVQCADDVTPMVELTAIDNCDGDVPGLPASSIIPGDCPNRFMIHRSWTFTDACGNNSTVTQNVTVDDDTDPIWNYACELTPTYDNVCPDDAEISLNVGDVIDIHTSWTVGPNVIAGLAGCITDNCTAPEDIIIRVVDKTKVSNGCEATLTITFEAEDECGNIAGGFTCTYYIEDNTPPAAPNPPANVTVQCADDVPPPVDLTAQDECQGPITVSPTGQTDPGDCPNRFVMIRTWTFDDGCGNVSSVSQTITVDDNTDPIWNLGCELTPTYDNVCPDDAEISLSVGDVIDIYTSWTVGPNEIAGLAGCITDNCTAPEDIIIRVVDKTKQSDGCDATLTITFEAEDECGNIAGGFTCTYYIEDNTPAEPPVVSDMEYDCINDVPPPGVLIADDECQGPVEATGVDSHSGGQGCAGDPKVITRTWTFDDGCGNISSVSKTITVEAEEIAITVDNITGNNPNEPCGGVGCGSQPGGSIELTVRGGCEPYSYVWTKDGSFFSNDLSIYGLGAGLYCLTVTDANGCTAGDCYELVQSPPPVIELDGDPSTYNCDYNVSCNGAEDGFIHVTISDGCPDYTYVWTKDGGFFSDREDIDDIGAGYYCLTVTDGQMCMATRCFTITEPDPVTVDIVAVSLNDCGYNVSCDEDDGSILVQAGGGCPPYTYSWTGPDSYSSNMQNIFGLAAGEYCVTATDANGCTAMTCVTLNSDNESPTWNPACAIDATYYTSDGAVCPEDAEISLNVGDVIDIYDSWTVGGVLIPGLAGCAFDDCTEPADLIIHITNKTESGNGCERTLTITFVSEDECGNLSVEFTCAYTFVDDTPAVQPVVADLNLNCSDEVPQPGDLTAVDDCQGPVTASGADTDNGGSGCAGDPLVITRTWEFDDGCGNTSSASQTITVEAEPLECSIPDVNSPACDSEGNTLSGNVSGGCGPYTYSWMVWSVSGDWMITDGSNTSTITYTAGAADDALFILTVTDANGCETSCQLELSCTPGEYCTLTQGFYGNEGGLYCDGRGTEELIEDLLSEGDIVLGDPALNKSITFTSGDGACVILRLPGGGPAASLIRNATCDNPVGITLQGNTRFKNNLLAQALTLALNLRLDSELGNLELMGTEMTTAASNGCGEDGNTPVSGTEQSFYIPEYFVGNTVNDILDLANDALAGEVDEGMFGAIVQAMEAINDGFDECRFLVGFNEPVCYDCSGNAVFMELRYDGLVEDLFVEVKGNGNSTVYWSGTVNPGDAFCFIGEGGGEQHTLAANTRIFCDNSLYTTVRTDCSDEIGEGASLGDDFTVIASVSTDGIICPVEDGRIGEGRVAPETIISNSFPNPFFNDVAIEFTLPERAETVIEILDINGQVIKYKEFGSLEAATPYVLEFKSNGNLPAGTYYYRIVSGSNVATGTMILMK